MFSFFARKKKSTDLGWLKVDMHSHILPGIDDGCVSIDQSIQILDRLQELGLSSFYFTPHVFAEMYPNNKETVSNAYRALLQHIPSGIDSAYAAEYMVDSVFEKDLIENDSELLLLPNEHILIEMSYMQESLSIEDVLFNLKVQGYKPILAHPERYVYYHGDRSRLKRFKEIGVLFQVNILSLIGYYGKREKHAAKWLADQGGIDLLGTDVHHERHVNAIEVGLGHEDLRKVLDKCDIKNEVLFAQHKVLNV
ncbi:histidinol phosphatase [Sphingobacterium psychroaquaticum]|uniref:tyrosine-protein phosphatase n=1 Tax=Sphingobacterium psychroaquaticum TaxID=561061 RepID=UPI00106B4F0F|nr:CpsB/CapC family capsule biosynthesis tyrosine phosphatase [Sphingobacterium psychroaquaticum]QBQ39817.1 histidinol phosphatase [Sphingobacterium psychroaquaticum]